MKSKTGFLSAQVILCAVFVVLLSGCVGKYPLNGVWSGTWVRGENAVVSFIDDTCFVKIDKATFKADFTIEKNDIAVAVGRTTFQCTLKGNTLSMKVGDNLVIFNKDTSSKTPSALKGVWNGPNGSMAAIVNDKVFFVDFDGDADYATISFNKGSGSFKSERYGYDVKFTVNGDTLDSTVDGEKVAFTRVKK